VEAILKLGVKRAIVGTLAVESPEPLADLVREFGDSGSDRIAVGIDAKDGEVMVRGWEQRGKIRAAELARLVAQAGVERIIYTDVARDGMMSGPNVEQTRLLARESGLKVTASGGVSSLADLDRLKQLESVGVDSVIVGKALYERRFTFAEAIKR
jgi:phosphoribosylformimino-5-aminoimidazole carboxamide ribotide isomerase